MVSPPAKKLKSVVRPFISAVAAPTASRRGLAAAQAPSFIPKSAASSKSKQSAAKLLTAKYRNFFEPDAEPHETTNETVARLKELAEEQNCWVAELLLDLCPLEPDADPTLLDAFSLANIKSGSCFYFPSKQGGRWRDPVLAVLDISMADLIGSSGTFEKMKYFSEVVVGYVLFVSVDGFELLVDFTDESGAECSFLVHFFYHHPCEL